MSGIQIYVRTQRNHNDHDVAWREIALTKIQTCNYQRVGTNNYDKVVFCDMVWLS